VSDQNVGCAGRVDTYFPDIRTYGIDTPGIASLGGFVEDHTGIVNVGEPKIPLAIMGFDPMLALETLALTLQMLIDRRQLIWSSRLQRVFIP
jgi:hypothetical protein